MKRRQDEVYELPVSVTMFDGRDEWQFKFVVNGTYWVEPPASASNVKVTNWTVREPTAGLLLRLQ
jgi:hypothetical protein